MTAYRKNHLESEPELSHRHSMEHSNVADGNSIINLSDISKPATVLIEKISSAVGIVFEPHRVKRMARAEAEANKIKMLSRIELNEIEDRAIERFVSQEARKQENIESITAQAAGMLPQDAEVTDLDEDWIAHFFKQCDTVSNKQMQTLWASLLSGEATKPGKYSKRTVDFISTMNKSDAELFSNLCAFIWAIGEPTIIVMDFNHSSYTKGGVDFAALKHLDAIGLISFEPSSGYITEGFKTHVDVSYYGQTLRLGFKKETTKLPIGSVLLTNLGKELITLCHSIANPEHFHHVKESWSKHGITVSTLTNGEGI